MAITEQQVESIRWRSRGRCEAQWDGARCRDMGQHIHHRIPKSRGGRLLDDNGDWAHLIWLCQTCHVAAHHYKEGGTAHYDDGPLMIHGEIMTWIDKRPYYQGPFEPFTVLYPKPKEYRK